jgi:hypothetical protein
MGTRFAGISALLKFPEIAAVGYSCATLYLNFLYFHFGTVNTCFGFVNAHFGNPETCSRSAETAVHHQPKSVFTFPRNRRSLSTEIRSDSIGKQNQNPRQLRSIPHGPSSILREWPLPEDSRNC